MTSDTPLPPTSGVVPKKRLRDRLVLAGLAALFLAGLAGIVAATGWQSHTVRGAMAGALKKKLGLEVTSEKVEDRGRVYRIA